MTKSGEDPPPRDDDFVVLFFTVSDLPPARLFFFERAFLPFMSAFAFAILSRESLRA